MKAWFDELLIEGPNYGYYPKPSKCILVVKPPMLAHAKLIFKGTKVQVHTEGSKDTGVEVTSEGTRHLGAAVGTTDFKHNYIKQKIEKWITAVKKLSEIATTQPHAAYATFTHCLQSQWTFLSRTMTDCSDLFEPLEQAIREHLIHALFKRSVNDTERDMLSLPARMGGMGICKPTEECLLSNKNSIYISAPLVRLIEKQEYDLDPRELAAEMKRLRSDIDKEQEERYKAKREESASRAQTSSERSKRKRCLKLDHSPPLLRTRHNPT